MKDWQIIGLTVLGGLLVGYVLAKSAPNVQYHADGTPIGPSIGTDPTTNFVGGPLT